MTIDINKAQAALDRAAHKAIHGTREDKQGRFTTQRTCGDCQLCCRLLAVPPLGKIAGQKCKHQKFGKGCTVYHSPAMPRECGIWNCRWLVGDDTADQSRPDRSHIVIDIMPDFVTLTFEGNPEKMNIQVVQCWVDPRHPNAHLDPAFRAYVLRRAEEGKAAIIRYDGRKAFTLFAPPLSADGQWHEVHHGTAEKQHSFDDIARALGPVQIKTMAR